MATAGATVERLLRRLASGARRSELPSDIDQHVAHVRRTLSRLQDVLVSVERYFWMRTEVQDWMAKINQIVYGMENLLDEFEDQNDTESQRSGCITKATSLCSPCPFFLYSTRVNRMKTLKKRLDHLARNSDIFTMMQHPRCDVEQTDMQEEFCRAAIVGRDSDKTKIEELISQDNAETLCIIPIVGLVGLGKTTLARLIFYDQGEGCDFDLRIWIDLNRKFDLRKIAADIISQANETKEDGSSVTNANIEIHENLQLLKNRLQETLHDKSCLIVLDGLCSTDKSQLDELKEMLRGTNMWINVLVTTSSEITAELMHTFPPYKLLPLSEDDCWTIFSEKAFGDGDHVNAYLKEIGRQIVKRCEGIPALARSLGSIVHNQVMDVWLAVRDEPLWKLQKTYSTKIKLFSPFYHIYYDMPSALKLCFLYLSVFPKGSVLDKEKLIRQWIALDMIGSKHETLPSYVHGEMYIQDLLSIHFLQVQKTPSVNGIENKTAPKMLYMHNVVHDFARHIASNDIIILDGGEMNSNSKGLTFQYILLTYYREHSILCSPLITSARGLHFQNTKAIKLHREAFKLLKHMRVFNLSGSCIQEIPDSIGHLRHLRYLDISDLKIQILPSSMSTLTNLEALDLSNTSLKKLPRFIGNFLKLRCLNLQGCQILQHLPLTFGHLQRLEHLRLSCCYNVGELDDSLCNLQHLRLLDLSNCTELTQLPSSFGNLMNLEDLDLSGCFNLKHLPESFGNICFLRFLNISSCYELQQLPGSLTNLGKLEVLILRRCRKLQKLPPSFRNIQCLRVLDLAGCEALQVSTEIMTTNLEHLNLQRCRRLQTHPNCFQNFTKLKFLNLSECQPYADYHLNLSKCPPNIDYFQSLGYLFNLEYLNLSQTVLDIPVSFERLQKLHMLDLTGCVVVNPSSGVSHIFSDMINKMTRLKFVLTKDPTIVASLPQHIRCSVGTDEHWHITSDELLIPDLTGGSRGLGIAERINLQSQAELRFLKLEWMPNSQPADVVDDAGEEVLEKLQPNQSLEHLELVGYAGPVFPRWMMGNMMTSLPNIVSLHLFHLENCKDLPPLSELRNLLYLHIKDVPKLTNLQRGLSGGPRPFKKLTRLNLESLFNLEALSILLASSSGDHFMFPCLEELSVVSCCKLMFEPSLPKCLKYEIRESDRVLSCGEPTGPSSSSPPVQIEITGCRIPSSFLQWVRSLSTLEKAVIDACEGEDGQVLTSLGLPEIIGDEEQPSSYDSNGKETATVSSSEAVIPHELSSQIGAPTYGRAMFQNHFPWFSVSPAHKELLASISFSGSGSTASEDLSTISSDTFFLDSPYITVFTFEELKIATRNFGPNSLLGEGGSGYIYKGQLRRKMNPSSNSNSMVIAVKKFKPDSLCWPENWQSEMNFHGRISHPNLVKLLGYCLDVNNTVFVYEFMARGSLNNHLFRRGTNLLSWSLRVKILTGAARGLAFLHSLERPVIYRNFKASKILLDLNYNVKLSGLNLGKDGPCSGLSHVTTRVMGTYGYAAPEYIATGDLYVKSDVYSFGVVLLEVLTGRRAIDQNRPTGELNLVNWARPYLAERKIIHRVMDPRLVGKYSSKAAHQASQLARSCLSYNHMTRPSMNEIVDVLENICSMDTETREPNSTSLQLKPRGHSLLG
ncbi:putative disease resistance RPP13-like protein 1 [Lolium rigidum]|uniref:putative disease resistance RPP13-like protein 1 n=1 Tax=Lolium rigidum TaxID=89674 RepID=UPI001F5C2470|nr:putative disease resistance RPP13-like protein 1 [Lolium rigidum]